MKSLSLRKVLKNCGQDGAVKFVPRLVSKGCGRAVGADTSGALALVLDVDADVVLAAVVAVGVAVPTSVTAAFCRNINDVEVDVV